ncbi:PH domain-containing protein [Streptomyces sp. NPDC048384]|uniref:PH domain-containing protein n=1 Tax=Streptomyces sp. NPDC048384 TaxID=3155487 RepID=UPI00342DFE45
MPLPFLTADRAFEAADDVALPFDDLDRWRRPYRPGPWRVGVAALWLLLASYVLFAAVIIALTGTVTGAAVVFGIALAVIAGALRLLRMGVWVSASGLRQVRFFATRTVPWQQVVAVRTVQQPVRWLGLPRTVQGQALMLVRRDRADDMPTLMTTHNADFMARVAAFNRATDAVEAWAADNTHG